MKVAKDYFLEFKAELAQLSDSELIDRFNFAVGVRAFGVARQGYLWAMREELQERKIDFSSIGDDTVMSFKSVVFLKDKKLFRLSELEKEDAQERFVSYML